MIKNLLNLFNESINEVIKDEELTKGINRLGEYTNLKLYDICSEFDFDTNCDYDNFNLFCQFSFEDFEDYLNENHLKMDYIGRTSSFRLIDKNSNLSYYYGQDWEDVELEEKVTMLLQEFLSYSNIFITVDDIISGEHTINEEDIEEFDYYYNMETNEDKDFIKDFKDFVKYEVEYLEGAYKYIEDFKENQCAYYKEFLGE